MHLKYCAGFRGPNASPSGAADDQTRPAHQTQRGGEGTQGSHREL